MWKVFQKAPASWVAVIQAVVALIAAYVDRLPQEAVVTLILAVTGLGFAAQKVEDGKTMAALWTDPISDEDDDL